jgi:hypothetical protein
MSGLADDRKKDLKKSLAGKGLLTNWRENG